MATNQRHLTRRWNANSINRPLDNIELWILHYGAHPFSGELPDLPAIEAMWADHREQVLEDWLADPVHCGARPWCWWCLTHRKERAIVHPLASSAEWAPIIAGWRQADGGYLWGQRYFGWPQWGPLLEDSFAYLARLDLLVPGEREKHTAWNLERSQYVTRHHGLSAADREAAATGCYFEGEQFP